MEKKSVSVKPIIKNFNFPTQFCPGNIYQEFGATESRQVSLKRNVYDLSVDYNAIDKSNIINIIECIMVKNKIK